jgi:hypothetical protein
VQFSEQAEQTLQKRATGAHEREVIAQVLAQDPRPAYKKSRTDEKQYAVNLFDLNVKFIVTDKLVTVTSIERF